MGKGKQKAKEGFAATKQPPAAWSPFAGAAAAAAAQALRAAITAYNAGKLQEAARLCDAVLRTDGRNFDALNLLGTICARFSVWPAALELFTKAVELRPDDVAAINNRGIALGALHHTDEAEGCYRRALQIQPDYVDALSNLGMSALLLQRNEEAVQTFERALSLQPRHVQALNNLGLALCNLQRFEDALASFDRALAIQPSFPEAINNRGTALRALNRQEEALACHEHAVALQPGFAQAHYNRGVVLEELAEFAAAMPCYDRAVALRQNYASAWRRKAMLHLALGQFEAGWPLYEWRHQPDDGPSDVRAFAQPPWLGGDPPEGQRILIHAEQGLGDTLQFCRYIPMVQALGFRVVLEVQAGLAPLMRTLGSDIEVVAQGDALPEFDCQCPLLSLPLAFHTVLNTVPRDVPYLSIDPDKQHQWHAWLGPRSQPRVGVVWSGAARHLNDRSRSIPVALWGPLMEDRLDIDFHRLHKEHRAGDAEFLAAHPHLHDWEIQLLDFTDTAALIGEMDLVISVDTSVAHAAGALGKPVWLLLNRAADFRWMTARDDSPWYPHTRIFRQARQGDWAEVLARVHQALETTFPHRPH